MSRPLRQAPGGVVYHVLNRANARANIFVRAGDYAAFEKVLAQTLARTPLELFCYSIMPNHWHLLLRPHKDGQLSDFMRWLTLTHTQRYHAAHQTSGSGHLYQGRFKSFPVQTDEHFLAVARYVERNALRAKLVERAEHWRWCSLWRREHEQTEGLLSAWPVDAPPGWLALVNRAQSAAEEEALRRCVNKGRPYGSEQFVARLSRALGLASTLREPGRPSKRAKRDVRTRNDS